MPYFRSCIVKNQYNRLNRLIHQGIFNQPKQNSEKPLYREVFMLSNSEYYQLLDDFIPWGSSTCSKHAVLVPEEPAVIVRGKGCRVWDADGREFIDYRNALGPISLGYCYPAVDEAIRKQLADGILFGHPHILEAETAELFCSIVPCAEKARFLKTGGEAAAAAIKIARAATGRDHVIQIGYNGWLNSMGSGALALPGRPAPRNLPGIPQGFSDLHHTAAWNDRAALENYAIDYSGRIAAVIVAADYRNMEAGRTFYPYLREFADRIGALLIFDEIVTGFRMATGGVQEYFGVTPDLAVFAKAIANGMPLSVYCGKAEYMNVLKDAIVSSTYAGDALSLAAAKAVMQVYKTEPVIEHLWSTAQQLWGGFNALAKKYNMPISVPEPITPIARFVYGESDIEDFRNRFRRGCYANGISFYEGGYVNYSHHAEDIAETLEKVENVFRSL